VTALACALLALTLAGPATARPIDTQAQPQTPSQDLRNADRRAPSEIAPRQDLRSPDAFDASRADTIEDAWKRYYANLDNRMFQDMINAPGATAVDSATQPAPVPVADGSDGVDWPAIGIVLAGGLLFAGGLVAVARRHRVPA
jgi:hypothetical protein